MSKQEEDQSPAEDWQPKSMSSQQKSHNRKSNSPQTQTQTTQLPNTQTSKIPTHKNTTTTEQSRSQPQFSSNKSLFVKCELNKVPQSQTKKQHEIPELLAPNSNYRIPSPDSKNAHGRKLSISTAEIDLTSRKYSTKHTNMGRYQPKHPQTKIHEKFSRKIFSNPTFQKSKTDFQNKNPKNIPAHKNKNKNEEPRVPFKNKTNTAQKEKPLIPETPNRKLFVKEKSAWTRKYSKTQNQKSENQTWEKFAKNTARNTVPKLLMAASKPHPRRQEHAQTTRRQSRHATSAQQDETKPKIDIFSRILQAKILQSKRFEMDQNQNTEDEWINTMTTSERVAYKEKNAAQIVQNNKNDLIWIHHIFDENMKIG